VDTDAPDTDPNFGLGPCRARVSILPREFCDEVGNRARSAAQNGLQDKRIPPIKAVPIVVFEHRGQALAFARLRDCKHIGKLVVRIG
jgi:hypothetical protein